MVNFQPDTYGTINPSITVDGAAAAIEFYTSVFGATERMRLDEPGGQVGHAELQFGDSVLMLNDPYPEMGAVAPDKDRPTSTYINVYVPDVDAIAKAAVDAGATLVREPADQFYGDRAAVIVCPWGHRWGIMTHIEDVTPEEMQRRAAEQVD